MIQNVLIFIVIILALSSAGLFYKLEQEKKTVLSQQVTIEKLNLTNHELKAMMNTQNSEITVMKNSSEKFKKYMEELNTELDNIIVEHDYINKNVVSSEDAIEWLKSQALQF